MTICISVIRDIQYCKSGSKVHSRQLNSHKKFGITTVEMWRSPCTNKFYKEFQYFVEVFYLLLTALSLAFGLLLSVSRSKVSPSVAIFSYL